MHLGKRIALGLLLLPIAEVVAFLLVAWAVGWLPARGGGGGVGAGAGLGGAPPAGGRRGAAARGAGPPRGGAPHRGGARAPPRRYPDLGRHDARNCGNSAGTARIYHRPGGRRPA